MYKTILQTEATKPPDIRGAQPSPVGEGVIDESTFRAIEVDKLFDSVNSADTVVGKAVLYRSLAQPLDSESAVKAKQESVREIETDSALREKLELMVQKASTREAAFYDLLYGTFVGFFGKPSTDMEFEDYGYQPYRKGTRFMLELVQDACNLPDPQSRYAKEYVEAIRGFASTRAYSLMRGPVYITESGIKSKQEKSLLHPALIFRPTLFKPLFIAIVIGLLMLVGYLNPIGFFQISASWIPILSVILIPALVFYVPMVGSFDRDSCIVPLRDIYKSSAEVQNTLEALGCLEELLAFYHFGQAFRGPAVLPEIVSSENHWMTLKAARNPILAKGNPYYVPNDIELDGNTLTLISGPNSGGKTAFCKTVAQIQLLTQIGCYVPAQSIETTLADRIFYQVPEISHLEHDGEGRFGTELRRTKEIFLTSSHCSLIVLDELSEGTTYEEKLETSFTILDGFYQRGGNTILITHNHELIDQIMEKKMGQARQVEFKGHSPTYRLIDGISRVSHADIVAKRIGFSKQDIKNYLEDKGYTGKLRGKLVNGLNKDKKPV